MSTSTTDPVALAPGSLERVREVLDGLAAGEWWRAGEADLVEMLGAIGRIRHDLARVEVHATAQVLNRGLPKERGMSPVDYLTVAQSQHATAPPVGHALTMVRLAEAMQQLSAPAGLGTGPDGGRSHTDCVDDATDGPREEDTQEAGDPAGGEPLGDTLAAFDAGLMGPSKAAAIVRFHNEVARHSPEEALASAMGTINRGASDTFKKRGNRLDPLGVDKDPESLIRRGGWTDRELRMVLNESRKIIKPAKELEDEERRGRAFRSLHSMRVNDDLTEYRLVVDEEGAAVIDAALAALSSPKKDEDGNPDPRSAPQRKADALLTVVRRGVSAPEGVPQTTKAQVVITMRYSTLLGFMPGAGMTMTGQVLSPQTVRRIACDAGIVPMVLGSEGEILEMGQEKRLFTPGQHRALWHRDKKCTFPGCTIPPQWCDAHHVKHWADGGPTDLSNGALLCQRHHTYVHSQELTATVTATGVTWHTWHT